MLDKIGEAKMLADYCLMRMLLKSVGYWLSWIGIFLMLSITVSPKTIPVNGVQFAQGIVILILGILLIKAPSANTMLVVGCVLFMIFIWNGYIFTLKSSTAGYHFSRWLLSILILSMLSRHFFKYYERFACLRGFDPPQQAVADMDRLITSIVKGEPEKEDDLVEFSINNQTWKCRLMDDAALLVETRRVDLVYTGRDQFKIADNGSVYLSKPRKITINADDRELTGEIAPDQLERYQVWKDREDVSGIYS